VSNSELSAFVLLPGVLLLHLIEPLLQQKNVGGSSTVCGFVVDRGLARRQFARLRGGRLPI
jgi:hypothetical protein